MRGSDLLIKTLSDLGTSQIFCLSGNQIMSIFDSSIGSDIDLIHFRHEAATVHAADTWGRLTNQPGVAMVTAGPGFANTLSALYVAMAAESPLVLISGHSQLSQQGKGAFQEMPQADMAKPVTKSSWTCNNTKNIGYDIERAHQIAISGRPGPVHITIPVDILEAELIPNSAIKYNNDSFVSQSLTKSETINLLETLKSSNRPLALLGQGISRLTRNQISLGSLSDSLPMINMESPRGVNDPSLGAFPEILKESDLILLLGKKLDFGLKFGDDSVLSPNANIIHIDHEISVLDQAKKSIQSKRLVISVQADPLSIIEIINNNDITVSQNWLTKVKSALNYKPSEWTRLEDSIKSPMHPLAVCKPIADIFRNQQNTVFISDGGEFGQWTQASISTPNRIINGPSGAIGSSIPAAIAASLAHPESTVIAMLGDGTFGFHCMEFDTAVRYNLKFVTIIGNDAKWNAEHQIQLRDYGLDRTIGCDLNNSRYDLLVNALGGHGENVTTSSEFGPALERAMNSNLPSCINVSIDPVKAPEIKRD